MTGLKTPTKKKSSIAEKHGPCLLTEKKNVGFRNQVPEEIYQYLLRGKQDQRLGAEQDQCLVCPQEPLLATVMRRNLAWFGHVTNHDNLYKTILQGTFVGGRRCGRQRKCLMDIIRG